MGLLEIKALINPNSIFGHLGDWTANKELDIATRRVIQLGLPGVRDYSLGDLVLNASLFLPFKDCEISLAGFEVLSSKLRKLNVLDLGHNRLNDDSSMLSCLTGLSSLKSLDLSGNMLTGSTGVKVLSSRLKKLENLDLSGNPYNDSIFSSLTGFTSLKSLDLSDKIGADRINSW
ncbi:hypothetical protein DKX38_017800 [Salix brachista]|uniref:Leucine-rich repeat-containing N-terminal plant-type domain-containing protein n=1 Tax=Salix brachista TaxID=2182728 RepID=A0A5N5KW87_9ROSI|nr:hypothetical protein DKX38_017800 [Salix brachista]